MTRADSTASRGSAEGPTDVELISIDLPADVRSMLQAADPDIPVLILPPHQRDGRSYYGPDDVDAVRLARKVGLNAAFLHKAEDREYLHEYSAGWAVDFAVAFAAQIAAEDVVGIINYIIARAHKAVHDGLHIGPAEKVPLDITVTSYRREPDGTLVLKGVRIKGSEAGAIQAIRTLVNSSMQADESAEPVASDKAQDALEDLPEDQGISARVLNEG
jgi:hypothetical protein